jgi:hypothetical protein
VDPVVNKLKQVEDLTYVSLISVIVLFSHLRLCLQSAFSLT